MKRLIVLVALAVVLTGLLLSGVPDTPSSIADATVPDDQVASGVSESNSPHSANATITITWRTAPLPDG